MSLERSEFSALVDLSIYIYKYTVYLKLIFIKC